MCPLFVEIGGQMKPADHNFVKQEGEVEKNPTEGLTEQQDGPSPRLSHTASLTTSDSVASSSSDWSVDANSGSRDTNVNDVGASCQDIPISGSNGHINKSVSDELKESDSVNDNVFGDGKEGTSAFGNEIDAIWMPPEAENEEDERSVFDDDDDEYGDGMNLPSSLDEEVSKSQRFKVKKHKAIEEVKTGKFKGLVRHLINSVGLADSDDCGESWVDIVASLAWDAASFVKPNYNEGKAMDPAGSVKIKCIPTGSRKQSQLVRGLVFKKHAAHKHMPTKYSKPRLLLIRGMLGQANGLASFNSMIKEKDRNNPVTETLTEDHKTLLDNLEACHPNVILVEKSAPRIVLEEIVKKSMTLVSDMKLHRLERVARCTGSPILSSDDLLNQELKHCDKLYFEKFIEEYAVAEGGKMPSKTLMFIEGCPTRLGCTILLKGSRSDELKKIKCVVQCAVVMAYHFILETSFLLDQQVMFSTISPIEMLDIFPTKQQATSGGLVDPAVSMREETGMGTVPPSGKDVHINDGFQGGESPADEPTSEAASSEDIGFLFSSGHDIPIVDCSYEKGNAREHEAVTEIAASHAISVPSSNGFHREVSNEVNSGLEGKSMPSGGADAQEFLKALGPTLPFTSPTMFETVSSHFGLNERDADGQTAGRTHGLPTSILSRGDPEASNNLSHVSSEAVDAKNGVIDNEESIHSKDNVSSVLDAESILVLKSRRNASRGTICEQSRFSHIKFYRNFDDLLWKYLRVHLLNETRKCEACGELPEAHYHYFAHHSKQLTVRVKKNSKYELPGASEGKMWMWSRCGECKPRSTNEKSTKRVLISTAARGLSFGKFLELCFSNDSLFNSLSTCGHSLHKDFLYFFGLGHMVAMFRNSAVVKYTVSLPPQKLEFNNPIKGEWLEKETEIVVTKGIALFSGISDYLKRNESHLSGRIVNLPGCPKEFIHIQKMLVDESDQFHISYQRCTNIASSGGSVTASEYQANIRNIYDENIQSAYKLLRLNRFRCDLLLEAWLWNQRLQLLLSSDDSTRSSTTSSDHLVQGKTGLAEDHAGEEKCEPPKAVKEIEPTQALADDGHCPEIGALQHDPHSGGDAISENEAAIISAGIISTQVLEGEEHRNIEVGETKTSDDGWSSTNVAVQIDTISESAKPGATLGPPQSETNDTKDPEYLLDAAGNVQRVMSGKLTPDLPSAQEVTESTSLYTYPHLRAENGQTSDLPLPDQLIADRTIPIMEVPVDDGPLAGKTISRNVSSSWTPNLETTEGSVWSSFSDIRREHMEEIYKDGFPNFESSKKVERPIPSAIVPIVSEVIMEEGLRHHIPLCDSDYIVSDYEGEVSSILACALAKLKDVHSPVGNFFDEDPQKEKVVVSDTTEGPASLLRATSEPGARWNSRRVSEPDAIHPAPSMSLEMRFSSFDGLNLLDSLSSNGSRHQVVSLGSDKYPGKSKCTVICMYATEFRGLRDRCCPSELYYIASLSRCKTWDAKGGKSKSFFAKTLDDRLIIKEIKKTEFDSFVRFADEYFKHMQESVDLGNQTCLAKILGIYQVTVRQPKSGKEIKQDLMVMENLSFGRKITRQYDLKGALHARLAAGDGSGDVLLDQNFVNDMNASPMYVGQKAKRLLERAVWNDTPFLGKVNVMDYSLLVGVDEQKKELVCGIIDYLRQYTWDKQLENWVKSSLVVPKNVLPTIISPNEYRTRFKKFIGIHFLTVPDNWCLHRSSKPCKLCGIRGDHTPLDAKSERQEELNGF